MESSIIFSIIGVVTGLAGMITGFIGILHNRFLAVHDFFTSMEDPDFISARHFIYNKTDHNFINDDDAAQNAAKIINFFQHWGLLSRKHYLPMWVFDSGSGAGTIRLFERTKDFIHQIRKKNSDPTYADEFERLYKTLLKRKNKKLKRYAPTAQSE